MEPEIPHHLHKILTLDVHMNQMKLVHIVTLCLFKIDFNIILNLKWFLVFRVWLQYLNVGK